MVPILHLRPRYTLDLVHLITPPISKIYIREQKYGSIVVPHKASLSTIGSGSTAKVSLLTKPSLTKLAIKTFSKPSTATSQDRYLKKLSSEFCISHSLVHQNIVQTLDLLLNSTGEWCEVMEFCDGGTLYDLIHDYTLSKVEIDCIWKQLWLGVHYLHGVGVAHRDLKPENLLFDVHGCLKIADFGVSHVFLPPHQKTPTLAKGLCGSEPYIGIFLYIFFFKYFIAPEIFVSQFYQGNVSDIWSCGVIYFALNFRALPWRKPIIVDQHYSIFFECYTAGKEWCPIVKMLAKTERKDHDDGFEMVLKGIFEPNPKVTLSDCGVSFLRYIELKIAKNKCG